MLTLVMVSLPVLACAQQSPALKTDKDKLSYAMGMDLGTQLKTKSVDIDPAVFARGLGDALSGGKTLLTIDEAKAAISGLQKAIITKMADQNKANGDAYLAANKAKEGVVTLPSGVQYKILTEGTGKKPTLDDTVVCHYRGTLIDGNEFANSNTGNPATGPVKGFIKGWVEVLQLMPVGSKWQVFVPWNLAYGERGAGTDIGPNSALIFEIELLAIK
jgi:FKBP-type peptidyl-prolyl cis-trans isomerase